MNPDFSEVDFDKLAEGWNRFYPHKFRIDGETLLSAVNNPTCATLQVESSPDQTTFLCVKRSGTPNLFQGSYPGRAHIGAVFSETLQGLPMLVSRAVRAARDLGATSLAFGMDSDHLFPGIPEDMAGVVDLFAEFQFKETGRCFDLERDLAGYVLPDECQRSLSNNGASVRPCTEADMAALDEFFAREFPARWRHDVMRKVRVDQEPDQVFVLLVDGNIEGFAMTQQDGCKRPISGAVWRLDLGPSWGALGPIGVSKAVRGKGLGNALLGYSLAALRDRGARQTIIDWTTLGDFYGAHGFEITRRYVQMKFDL